MSQLFASCIQTIGASASVLPMTIQSWLPSGLTALISLLSKGLLRGWLQNWYNNSEGVLCCEIEKLVKMLILSGIKVINLEEGGQKWNGKSWGRTLWFWIEIGDSHIKKLLTSPSSATACSTSQFRSVAQSCSTLCDPMDCSTPSFPVHHQLLELAQTHVHWVGDAIQHLILCRPLLLLPSIFPSIGIFSNESVLHIRWPKYWSFSFSISPSNEYSALISFMMDWFDLLEIHGTLNNLLQHHSSKHQFFGTQFSLWSDSHIHTCLLEKP